MYDAENFRATINELVNEIISQSKCKSYLWYDNLMDTVFTAIDILTSIEILDNPAKKLKLIEKSLIHIFNLNKNEDNLPSTLKKSIRNYSESLLFESFSQIVILVNLYLSKIEDNSLAIQVNSLVQAKSAKNNYETKLLSRELKIYKMRFKDMLESYKKYDADLEKIRKKFPYEKSIFIMMPFRFNKKVYKDIRKAIKDAAKKQGFTAYLSNDKDRDFSNKLWDRLVLNMLSCKYGIAVLPIEKIHNPSDEHKIKLFNNPNVALEFGFMVSRSEDNILILTDDIKGLPSDLSGLHVGKFNMDDPFDEVFNLVTNWLKSIKKKEAE